MNSHILLTALLNSLADCSVAHKSNFITSGNKSANRDSTHSQQGNCSRYEKLASNGYCTAAISHSIFSSLL